MESLTPPATTWNDITPAPSGNVSTTAGDSLRITATLADGSTVRDTITNVTGGVLRATDNADGTVTLDSTTNSTTQLSVQSEIVGSKTFDFTTKTGTQVSNTVTTGYDDPTTPADENITSSTFTHNTKSGEIELEKEATIESTASATFGDVNNIPESIKVEVFDEATKSWIETPLVQGANYKSLDIDPSVKSFRVTTDYGDGKKTRDTISNNTGGTFTIKEQTDPATNLANGVGFELVQTTGGEASSTQLNVKSDDLVVVNIHFGSGNTDADSYDTAINQVTAKALGVGNDAGDSVATRDEAKQALENLTEAIRRKDEVRAEIGSTQNRLSATIENVSIQQENLQASESRISDVDVATEMTEFNKTQIMTNAAVSMLAQANSLPQMAQKLIDGR
ncbi:flagellin [Halodesulfovibrio aestuarii]|uniref:Flagellin n=1 Tax=Halodesulfovibrio aestuarii TaxID=126333 RepID=A0ABV4JT79_9BACT